jgi:Protein of unknown function (DUF2490)
MKKHLFFILLGFCLMSSHLSYAQKSHTGTWISYFGNNGFAKHYNVWNEIQYRNYNVAGDLQQFIVRTGLGYNITEGNNNVLIGYAHVRSEKHVGLDDNKVATNENRVFQQFITKTQVGRVFIQHRYRVEERFIEQLKMQLRFRYFLGLSVPLNKKKLSKGAIYLSVFDEIFLNSKSSHFDRNRLSCTVGYVIRPYLRAEFGFMAQGIENDQRGQWQLVFFNTKPLTKRKSKTKSGSE